MRSSERAAAALACLTPYDRALLRVLHELRYLTSRQVHETCYAALSARGAAVRLGELRRRGVLTRLRRGAFVDRRVFWGLTSLGRTAARALEHAETGGDVLHHAAALPRSVAIAALQIDHLVATNEIFCGLSALYRAGALPPVRWLAGHRSAIDLGHTHLVPDGVVLAAGLDGWWTYYVERDRGTMSPAAIREKLDRYALLWRIAEAQRDDQAWQTRADGWLLVACDDAGRALRIAGTARDLGLGRVWTGIAGECAPGLAASLRGMAEPSVLPPPPVWAAGAIPISDLAPETRRHHKEDGDP